MMARSVKRNGTALSRRWKLGGEDNRRKEEKVVGSCSREGGQGGLKKKGEEKGKNKRVGDS
jgi:hypothetical protein